MDTNSKGGFIARKRPSSYTMTEQQHLIREAAEYCGLRKGMSRPELLKVMQECMPEFFRQKKEGSMPGKEPIKVYHAPACGPCHEVVDLLNQGRFESNVGENVDIDLIDVASEEGFKEVEKADIDSVPSAKYKGKTCKLSIDRAQQMVVIECEEGEKPKAETPEVKP